ncbi:HEPN domain-containing protein [Amycolatopsis japonica]|uniref:HEPN domain-containing protein n=1 Tax=Amycolatopsis japonica TaxID=208439 RepID=UPI0036726EFD
MSSHWPPRSLATLRISLDTLAEAVAAGRAERTDDEQIWLTRFLVVRTCGYLEQVVHETIRGYIHEKSGGLVRSFAHSWIERSRNPSPDNMLDLVGRLDGSLAGELQEVLDADDQYLRREISLLVDRRHKIAHGLNEGMNSQKAVSLKAAAEKVGEWFVVELNPDKSRKR